MYLNEGNLVHSNFGDESGEEVEKVFDEYANLLSSAKLGESSLARANEEFFRSNSFPKGCNSPFIALIPKVPNAKSVFDFRIILIGCQYKIIGKLLANRLSILIGDCISPVQSAFIKGRYILDGPLILNEVLAWYHQRKNELMVLKVDFEKAFDSLRWDLLDVILDKLGFGSKWHAWIRGCLHNARSFVLINGSPTKELELFRGLRQGDPMSPFLFILAMEGLHALTRKAEVLGLFKGATIGRDNMCISHLMYADDVIFFGEWSWVNAHTLISMLQCFFLISGLKINIQKSNVLGVGVTIEEVSQMANIIGCGASQFPLKYLGVPVGFNMPRQLESMRNKFFIGGDLDDKKMTWVKWDKCLASKKDGGLDIGSIYGLNIRLLFKWVWRFLNTRSDLWFKLSIAFMVWMGVFQLPPTVALNAVHGVPFFLRLTTSSKKVLILSLFVLARRNPRGSVESNQFCILQNTIRNINLSDHRDSWQWSFDSSKGFSVASARCLIDSLILDTGIDSTRWNRNIPIKWELDIPVCGNIAEWFDWLDSLHFPLKCMRTRNFYFLNNSSVTIPRHRNKRRALNVVEPKLRTIVEITPMADNRTMEELLQAPTEGYGEAIVIPGISGSHMTVFFVSFMLLLVCNQSRKIDYSEIKGTISSKICRGYCERIEEGALWSCCNKHGIYENYKADCERKCVAAKAECCS
uniref:RNA-directed DNA polymerase, eukaryota, reverse transcriptase zinc-binding domain protein n=1 Tax=Tanacetum cinerariifolium TaxID=118510 RepID=A0A6L2NFS3_TANCI|nr:RNA-directed DNA polymerase, eukaryota, reverse transcriptase zinc-binding domain protein [Tanacetum cinerariifolium]